MAVGPATGQHRFRIRQRLVRDAYAPLIRGRAYGAVKLDLLLRCIALPPIYAGGREPGFVLWTVSFEHLHDLVKGEPAGRPEADRDDPATRHLKRKWVADQLDRLVDIQLARVTPRPGKRPELVMRRDDGSGKPFDDPGQAYSEAGQDEPRDPYFTINGGLIGSGELKAWGAAELAAYFAALAAELQHPRGAGREIITGHGTWYRPLSWFNEDTFGPPGRVLLPFATSQLEKGLASLEQRRLIRVERGVTKDPRDRRRRFHQRRNVYHNRFDRFDAAFDLDAPLAVAAEEQPVVAETAVPGVADVLLEGLAEQPAAAPKSRSRRRPT
jgi:hypothetical protein